MNRERYPLLHQGVSSRPPPVKTAVDIVILSLSSLFLAFLVFVRSSAAWYPGILNLNDSRLGSECAASISSSSWINPPSWTLDGAWCVVYVWQAVWLGYAWTVFTCRRNGAIRLIFWGVYPTFLLVVGADVAWIFSIFHNQEELAMAFSVLMAGTACTTAGMLFYQLYRRTDADVREEGKVDLWSTRVLAGNGLTLYATWASLLVLLTIDALWRSRVSQSDEPVREKLATGLLAAIGVLVLLYFLLENSILDRFLRYTFVVYPLVLWFVAGVMSCHWRQRPNGHDTSNIISVVVLIETAVLMALRLALLVLFAILRPVARRSNIQFV